MLFEGIAYTVYKYFIFKRNMVNLGILISLCTKLFLWVIKKKKKKKIWKSIQERKKYTAEYEITS